ncbi:MAG: 50S ribosomal protein L15 [Candidatus Daviesbacteria bacterium GW2011_GWB1_39_5]|uniref:Large ribosomal subunit protein uL15 n=1 Tax=Candidatus Daviesbacteria bacterium GW2011_GWC2_40_12 TaxID=1618431 RepID=A0A0G0QPW7_9BACT|nr:MAG: 50S ribosomal protein L15 [Candidatus Daviesbacteria bacterium GW2011_GWF2_38_7]KKR17073.1 MAG: 50S ribosomal protein L15 [Candidatus Daviesbacteria bacterium GW2011_GWA2_39_33]KKR24280.1 MAG: 50S ribosomal protein L15 [Candidatus Daviesbacteria bacterium GW2011_GWB1_39_5]KKR42138.1 MAG: 50S ribosomal protein L15 [Candidatus Daviesbacteria bacterium GW2011_GWC2_40_12]OGE20943.1 MAG: 50S ribosomal protein L15 [Candidatus Daviesbacteria bacterium RIFCSPHIGHO2_01_FULL_40_24]OGE28295.1 MAG
MKLNELIKINARSNKRLGRGVGSGKGKTAGRGTKGQKARGKIPATFTGSLAFFKKLPLKRGKGNLNLSEKIKVINLSQLTGFKAKEIVDTEKLILAKIISKKDAKKGVKVLGGGDIETALIIKLSVSDAARKKIEKVGGKVMDA